MDRITNEENIFYGILKLSKKIQDFGDSILESITFKQWLLLALVIKTPPQERYITKIAEQAGLTRQNIKRQLDVLDKNEYIFIYPSNNDPRRLMVALTDKTKEKFYSKDDLDTSTLELLFQFFTSDELESFFANIDKLSTCLDAFICGKDGKPE